MQENTICSGCGRHCDLDRPTMWKYIRKYLFFAIIAGLFMVGEVMMDLVQPGFMSRIVDDGVLGVNNGGSADLHLIWMLGLQMIGLVLVGVIGVCLWKANPLFSRLQAQLDAINEIMQEDVSGIRIMKACVREAYEKMRFGKANDELVRTQLRTLVIFAFMNPLTNALMYVAVTIILLAGSLSVGNGSATPGNVMAALTYTTQLLNGILMLVMLFQNISRGLASWKRVKEVLESVPELKEGSFDESAQTRGEIEFRDVSFAYPKSTQSVLSHISLKIHKGETVAVIGATGCGKTTLAGLMMRFYDVDSGAILVDGIDVREYRQQALREKIAIAMQKSELFGMTVGENISWGMPGADETLLISAASIAQADSFISSLTNGYDTMIAERGMSLSGGQKQRISVARAVLKPAEIYIFDDSTSVLDLRTEANLYQALKKSHPDSTKIIIAQRIASVRTADRIVVLENSGILACGTHEELMRSCQVYQDIWHSQMGEEAKGA